MVTPIPLDRAVFLRPIAHRGLHDASAGLIENTIPAFAAAIRCGYGIECDVRSLADGTPVVFHDATLDRLIAGTGPVSNVTPAQLASLRYTNSDQRIATFADLLYLVGGVLPGRSRYQLNARPDVLETPAPLLVEIKSEWEPPNLTFLANIANQATAYRGPLALMSFDPAVISTLQGLAPTVPRGMVSGSYRAAAGEAWWREQLTLERASLFREVSDFHAVGASFVAYETAALPTPALSALRHSGVPIFAWTVRTPAELAHAAIHADAMIFEGFKP